MHEIALVCIKMVLLSISAHAGRAWHGTMVLDNEA
jgi:hypothetical protein